MAESKFQSLRIRLLIPLVSAAVLATVAIAIASYWLGSNWAIQQVRGRFEAIRGTLSTAPFPLSLKVLESIALLTQTDLIAYRIDGQLQSTTVDIASEKSRQTLIDWQQIIAVASQEQVDFLPITLDNQRYLGAAFRCRPSEPSPDAIGSIVVLVAEDDINAARLRAALLPLVTGLSTVVLLSSLSLTITGRLVQRVERLEKQVERVANGDFGLSVEGPSTDEIGRLGSAVNRMAVQLNQLWQAVNRQQRGKLLHQIAAGLAHQLRNSLTGARMAMELHARQCSTKDDEGLQVATMQLDQVEDTVKRLLTVGSDKQHRDEPANVQQCLQNTELTLIPFALHWQVDVRWDVPRDLAEYQVADGPTLSAAITNLVMNAMQAGKMVRIKAELKIDDGDRRDAELKIEVLDNGPGIADAIAGEVFEPFVTSKPEGLGLGLSVVKRSAESLGGEVTWVREAGWTRFQFTAQAQIRPIASQPSDAED